MVPNTKLSHYVILVSFMAYCTNEVFTADLNDSTRDPLIGKLFNDNDSPNISTQEISSQEMDDWESKGNPNSGINLNELYNFSCYQLKRMAVLIIERLTKQQVRLEFNSLGAFYVLGTLTLINSEARSSLPWLYQSFVH